MKNILGTTENLELFDKDGKLVYWYLLYSSGLSCQRTYNSSGDKLTFEGSDGHSWQRTYDAKGNQLTHTDSNGYNSKSTYDANGKELTYENSRGFSYKYTRDAKGNILTFENSDGQRVGFGIPEYTMSELVETLGNFKLKL